jgi:regulator of nonsense transcripts 1
MKPQDLGPARVILCTLNLLVNRRLGNIGYLDVVPLKILVVDEASQIELGSYLPILAKHESIEKICFFGDDKQCA